MSLSLVMAATLTFLGASPPSNAPRLNDEQRKVLKQAQARVDALLGSYCKGKVKIEVNEKSYPRTEEMIRIADAINDLPAALSPLSVEEKKVVCRNLKKYVIEFGQGWIDYKDGRLVVTCGANVRAGDEQVGALFAKWK